MPIIKNKITVYILPFPLLNKLPTYIRKKITERGIIFRFSPIAKPTIMKKIIAKNFPIPIPKYDPAYVIKQNE